MGVYDIKMGRVWIPAYDIATIVTGFLIGYNHTKGGNSSVADYMLVCPTVGGVSLTAAAIYNVKREVKEAVKNMDEAVRKLHYGDMVITTEEGRKKKLKDLDFEERKKASSTIETFLVKVPKTVETLEYARPMLKIGTRTALETVIGYVAGRLCSHFG